MLNSQEHKLPESPSPLMSPPRSRESDGGIKVDDPECTMATVAGFLEQLHSSLSSPLQKELITARLQVMVQAQKEVRTMIGSHPQAMPLFISVLRNGTPTAKVNVAITLSALCKEEELHVKVLLGGCIPPLLSLLKSESSEARKAAAEALFEVSSGGFSDDHIGMKIFVTEGVVPTLWDLLNPMVKQDMVVQGFVTGALRNLCRDKDGYWKATLEAGGVDIIIGLLSSNNTFAQANAASLLACLILAFGDSIPKVIDAGAVGALLLLLGQNNDISVRASAADALEALSFKSTMAKKSLVDAGGMTALIGAVVAPSKECMQGGSGNALQRHAVNALANICGGMSSLILYLGELAKSSRLAAPLADIIGALAYALMDFVINEEKVFDPAGIEHILIELLKAHVNRLVQDRILEALSSLYGNTFLAKRLDHADAKRVLIGLITSATVDVQEQLILFLTSLSCDAASIWEAFRKREGVQLLISLLGLYSEQHQEYAVSLLSILTDQVEESKWAITAAGGIPPLVQLLDMGNQNAREDAAHVLWNLCCHSDDIRACVESAGAVPALLWLLQSGSPKGQEVSAKALIKLIRNADNATINHLLALLVNESISAKSHAIIVLGHVLTMSSQRDLLQKGSPANKGLRCLVQVLNSSIEEAQECAASVLADLFSIRHDICDSLATDEIVNPCIKLLTSKTQVVAIQSARALGALSRPNKDKSPNKTKMSYIAEGDVKPLIKMAKISSIGSAETAVTALANLLSDPLIAEEALAEDVVLALTRVLGEGSLSGKKNASCALNQLLNHFPVGDVLVEKSQCQFVVLALAESLVGLDSNGINISESLDVLVLLTKTKLRVNCTYPLWFALSEVPTSLEPFVIFLENGSPSIQDKAIQILSRLCRDQSVTLGNLFMGRLGSITSLVDRIMRSSSIEVKIGGVSLLLCAAKEYKQQIVNALEASGLLNEFIYVLVGLIKCHPSYKLLENEVPKLKSITGRNSIHLEVDDYSLDPATTLAGTLCLWLLSVIASCCITSRYTFMEAGGVEALSHKLESYATGSQVDFDDAESIWVGALLMAIMFQEENVVQSSSTNRIIPSLSVLLKSDEINNRYFAAQAICSLICTGRKTIQLSIANAGAVGGLLSFVGHAESELPNLISLSEEFNLLRNPDEVTLRRLFEIEDIRIGGIARKSIPLLVDLLRPIPDRPKAAPIAVQLLTCIAEANDANKVVMAEAGALDALTKYLSLSPQDSTEATITDLLAILYRNPDLPQSEVSLTSLNQLIAVLRLGCRRARFSAAKALQGLFASDVVRNTEMARQAIQPLVDMLDVGSEKEQEAALIALIKLTDGDASNSSALADVEGSPLESLCKILLSSSSLELKKNAAQLCYVLFGNSTIRVMPLSSECVQPLISLMSSSNGDAVESAVRAFERLLEDEHHADIAAETGVVNLLVKSVSRSDGLSEVIISALIKLGKDRTQCKVEMVKAGIVDNVLEMLLTAPGSLCSLISELLRILTNNSGIAKSEDAARIVEPLFLVLHRTDIPMWGQHSALQALVNILEKPQSLATLKSTPSQVIEPLISFLESPSQAIQQLGTELLSHLLEQEHFQQDITTKNAVVPLVQLAGIGILCVQQTAIKALESISVSWPNAVADAGGMFELSKVIVQDDPQPSHLLWESAALVLSNVLKSNPEYYFRVPLVVLVRLLQSTVEKTVAVALSALIAQEKHDPSSGALMAEAGAVNALLDLLRSHQLEEASARLIEALFNNARVREKKTSKYAIAPLSQYLLDPQTRSQSAKFLAALALGDLFQNEGLARASDAVSACRALISLLEDQPTDEMKMVSLCALQNLVMHSRTNRRAVAEAGGILVVQELLLSPNAEVSVQSALLIKYLFSNHTLQEYASNELIRSLTAALEKELWSAVTTSEEVLRTIYVIFSNFKKLRASEAATLCIPHLVAALKAGSEAAQESVLDTLCLLKDSWSEMNEDIAKAQALIAAEAIPILQLLMKTCPPSFHERADSLLHCLPGCLTVTIKRGNNLKQTMGSTNAFCRLKIGNGPPKQTKVVSHNTCPEWKEGFTWAFDVPPKGQKLYILCKSKNTFGKNTLGRVTIQIDKVVSEGLYSGFFSLSHDSNKDGSRTLEIEILWSNRMSCDEV